MNRVKIFLSALFLVGILAYSTAQSSLFTISYSTGTPLGNTGDYIENYSWRGMSIEGRYFIERDLSLGFYIAWNVFHQRLLDYEERFENGVLYGNQYRYINAYPILLVAHYHLLPESSVRPYIGAGLGLYSMNRRTDMGLYYSETKSWHFGLAPEAGLWFDVAPYLNLMIGAKYNYAVKAQKADAYSFLNVNVGMTFVY
jgi:hypothetical protein